MRFTQFALGLFLLSSRVFAAPVVLSGTAPAGAETANLLPLVGTWSVQQDGASAVVDQAAGIAFAIQPSGDYLILRANGLDNNLILFQFKDGRRSALKEVRAPAPKARVWHELKMVVERGTVPGSVDGKQYLEFELQQPAGGRIGLWSKADSVVQFRDLDVQAGK